MVQVVIIDEQSMRLRPEVDILTDFKHRHELELLLEFPDSSELECPRLVRPELELAQLASGSSSQQHYFTQIKILNIINV